MKTAAKVAAFMALAATALLAQTQVDRGPVTATMKFFWAAPSNITTVADALTFEWRVKDGATPATALTGVTCVIASSQVQCQSVLGQSQADALNKVGMHSLTLTSFRQDVGESPASTPFSLQSPAGASTGFKIIQ